MTTNSVHGGVTVKITYSSTLPHSHEGRGRIQVGEFKYDAEECGESPHEWAAEMLSNAGCTRHNRGARYVTEEPKITDFARGEETTATGVVTGLNDDQVVQLLKKMER
ncbi:hypothetical protein [Streptomyces sp. NPDC088727]|uniref:hypothetical protein n=1 Tax=Streptomyces sp. NPDC088727 TaxID=3365875 RepID=UPI0037FE9415